MSDERIYLDHASGGLLLPAAKAAMETILAGHGAAPGGGHREARESRDELEKARQRVAHFLGTKEPEGVVFTSGGTEGLQSGIHGWGESVGKGTLYLSEMEHPAVESAVRRLGSGSFKGVRVPVDGEGRLKWDGVKAGFGAGLVCIHLAHHDLGTVQSISNARKFAEKVGAKLFVDATHGAGWVPMDVEAGADLVALSGHRLGAPKGSGALWIRSGFPWKAQIVGGKQEGDRRAGTENLPAIVGFGAALAEWEKSGQSFRGNAQKAQKILAEEILQKISCAKLHGPKVGTGRNPSHLSFSFAGLEAESLALVLDRLGLAVRGGSGCVTREMKIPPAMKAITAKPEEARALILFTLGITPPMERIREVADRVADGVKRLTAALPR